MAVLKITTPDHMLHHECILPTVSTDTFSQGEWAKLTVDLTTGEKRVIKMSRNAADLAAGESAVPVFDGTAYRYDSGYNDGMITSVAPTQLWEGWTDMFAGSPTVDTKLTVNDAGLLEAADAGDPVVAVVVIGYDADLNDAMIKIRSVAQPMIYDIDVT